MRFRVPFLALLVTAVSVALPLVAYAAVPFFGPIIPQAGNQGTCPASWGMVILVINNIISFALTVSIVFVAPLMIAWSGFLYVINPYDPSGISKAKSILINTFSGIAIALAAWMIVDAVMAVLYSPEHPGETWYSLVGGGVGTGGVPPCLEQAGTSSAPPVSAPATLTVAPTRTLLTFPTTPTFTPTLSSSAINSAATGASAYRSQVCAEAAQQGIAGQCNHLLGMLGVESGGNRMARSGAGAVGLMQLIPTTAAQMGVTACQGSSNTSPSAACVSALQDPATNIRAGVRLYAQNYQRYNGDVSNATAAYNAGSGSGNNGDGTRQAFSPSQNCPGMYAWQCPINPGGFDETQAYVANVQAVAARVGS